MPTPTVNNQVLPSLSNSVVSKQAKCEHITSNVGKKRLPILSCDSAKYDSYTICHTYNGLPDGMCVPWLSNQQASVLQYFKVLSIQYKIDSHLRSSQGILQQKWTSCGNVLETVTAPGMTNMWISSPLYRPS